MATNVGWALQNGLYQVLVNDGALTGLLGGVRIYDDAPQGAQFPYLTIGQSQTLDWSTSTEPGHEHTITLHVWSKSRGKRQAFEVLGRLEELLHDQDMTLTDHDLINMRHEFSQVRRDPDGDTYHGIFRLRAVSEPL